ncbi:MAG TPA: biotin/lipoyl-binding protein, partial [Caldilineae bacterium]|nr:biotin/lipoyl-binding protein [Caldilineae bacterium]
MKKILILLIFIALVAGGYYWYANYYAADVIAEEPGAIIGSGMIEAKTIAITSQTGGRIVAVYGREGDEVEAGAVLLKLDDSLLQAQRLELEAAIDTARANLDAAKATPRPSDIAAAEAAVAQARTQKEGAYRVWRQMLRASEEPQELLIPIQNVQAQIRQAQKQVEAAEVALKAATIQEQDAARDQSAVGKVQYQIAQKQRQAAK